jgi:hypothetical protein
MYLHTYICMYKCTWVRTNVHMYVQMCICTYKCAYVRTNVHMYVHMYVLSARPFWNAIQTSTSSVAASDAGWPDEFLKKCPNHSPTHFCQNLCNTFTAENRATSAIKKLPQVNNLPTGILQIWSPCDWSEWKRVNWRQQPLKKTKLTDHRKRAEN